MTNNFDTIREALRLLLPDYPETAITAIDALAAIEADMASAAADGFRSGVASVTAGQEPVGIVEDPYYDTPGIDWHVPLPQLKGVKLYAAPVAQQQEPVAWPTMPPSKGQSPVLFEDGYAEGWAKCLSACKALFAAPVAQQPQANSIESGGIKTDQQPQAEAVPPDVDLSKDLKLIQEMWDELAKPRRAVTAHDLHVWGVAMSEVERAIAQQQTQQPQARPSFKEWTTDYVRDNLHKLKQPQAEAVPLLSDAEVGELLDAARVPELPNGYEDLDMQIARAVEQAVRAKLGAQP